MVKNKSPKRGRPSKDLAGDVQARILDAAQQLFLEKGFRSASIDDISELAPASKPTNAIRLSAISLSSKKCAAF